VVARAYASGQEGTRRGEVRVGPGEGSFSGSKNLVLLACRVRSVLSFLSIFSCPAELTRVHFFLAPLVIQSCNLHREWSRHRLRSSHHLVFRLHPARDHCHPDSGRSVHLYRHLSLWSECLLRCFQAPSMTTQLADPQAFRILFIIVALRSIQGCHNHPHPMQHDSRCRRLPYDLARLLGSQRCPFVRLLPPSDFRCSLYVFVHNSTALARIACSTRADTDIASACRCSASRSGIGKRSREHKAGCFVRTHLCRIQQLVFSSIHL
jgi:hypothetical protein